MRHGWGIGYKTFFILAIIAACFAWNLSQTNYSGGGRIVGEVGGGADTAADGGALGFGIISAACFISSAFMKREKD